LAGDALAIDPSGAYRHGTPPSAIWVPTPVAVKKAGMPAPPARSFSAELLVLAHVGGDHPADPLVLQEDPQPPLVHAAVVGDCLEIGDTAAMDLGDEDAGDPAETEPPHGQR
jgi:hypothetical protein